MSNETNERLQGALELMAAILLGVGTVLGAYAAYQSSLWSGNSLVAYTEGSNKLGEANRELLRGVQERSFDAVVWMENIKQAERAAKEPAPAATAEGAEGAESETVPAVAEEPAAPVTDKDRAEEIVEELSYAENMSLEQKLGKLMKTRTNLSDAIVWADKHYEKRIASLTEKEKLELAKKIIASEAAQEEAETAQAALLTKAGVAEEDVEDEDAVAAALKANPDAMKEYAALDAKWDASQRQIEVEYEKLSKPIFFESPDYVRKQERAYKQLLAEGTKLNQDGQRFMSHGDHFTRIIVMVTIGLFFAGLGAVLKRAPTRIGFIAISAAVLIVSVLQMFRVPFA